MKKWTILAVALVLLSCNDDEIVAPELIGTWQLSEVLADPGDGSGTFTPVESNRTVTFLSSGKVESSESLCPGEISQGKGIGIYSLQDSTIIATCPDQEISINMTFTIEEANLILIYPCIEACAEKYVKVM